MSMKDSEKKVRKPVRKAESNQTVKQPEGLQALMNLTSAMYEAAKTKQPTAQIMKQFQITLDNIKVNRLA
jgi:hypothetical protein